MENTAKTELRLSTIIFGLIITLLSTATKSTNAQNLQFPEISQDILNSKSNLALNQDDIFQLNQSVETFDLRNPRVVKAADLDNDGDDDVVVVSGSDNIVGWYENLDGSEFSDLNVISTDVKNPWDIYLADIDGDGNTDVLSISSESSFRENDDRVAWYRNQGNGLFETQQIISTEIKGVSSVIAADIDEDGDLDVLSASGDDNKLALYENTDGVGTFSAQQVISTDTFGATSLVAADADADGDLDLFTASFQYDEIALYENTNGMGDFSAQQIISSNADGVESIFTADIDGDGDVDVLSASFRDDKIAWYENIDAAGTFDAQQIISTTAGGASSVFAADLDADGDLDVLSASYSDDKIAWYENTNGAGTFGLQQIISTNSDGASSVLGSDFDGDGAIDVILASDRDRKISLYMNGGAGTFGSEIVVNSVSNLSTSSLYNYDIDADGDEDLITVASDSLIVSYENNGDGTFRDQKVLAMSSNLSDSWTIQIADLDGDELPEIIFSYRDESCDEDISIIPNLGGGNFGAETVFDQDVDEIFRFIFDDVDKDGDNDLISTHLFGTRDDIDDIRIYFNLGDGIFADPMILAEGVNIGDARPSLADIDGDGDNDILIEIDNSSPTWFQNQGNGNFSGIISIDLLSNNLFDYVFSSFAVDLNNDGNEDLVASARLKSGHLILIWYENKGRGLFKRAQALAERNGSANLAVDLDLDGDKDLVGGGDYFENLGDGLVSNAMPIFNSVYIQVVADLDGDDDPDMAFINGGSLFTIKNTAGDMFKVPHQAFNDEIEVVQGTRHVIDALANDTNNQGKGELFISKLTQGQNGNAWLNFDHTKIIYEAPDNISTSDVLTYHVKNTRNSSFETSAEVSINLVELGSGNNGTNNSAPELFSPIEMSVLEDSTLIFGLHKIVVDSQDPTDVLTVSFSGLDNINVNLNQENGVVTLSALPDWWGSEKLLIEVTDSDGLSSRDSTDITFIPVNDKPLLNKLPLLEIPQSQTDSLLVWDYLEDVETPDSQLDLRVLGDLTSFYNSSTGYLKVSAGSDIALFNLIITATDAGNLSVTDTLKVDVLEASSTIDEVAGLPKDYSISQNYPNPFNPTTQIQYALPQASDVRLDVYNMIGQRVASLIDKRQTAGTHTATFDASSLSSGVYIYRIVAGDFTQTKKMLLIK